MVAAYRWRNSFLQLRKPFRHHPQQCRGTRREFTPAGQRQWDGGIPQKIHNLAYAISQFKTPTTPTARHLLGVERNRKPFGDGGCDKPAELRDLNLRIVHHDSPDARGVDVGLMYNPRYFNAYIM